MKNKTKKLFAFMLALFLIIPAINAGFITVSARINYLTVEYDSSHADFEQAYKNADPSNDPDITNLTIKGSGELTFADCEFIKNNLNVMSINFTDAKFQNNKIPDGAFADFYSLVSTALPLSVTEIGKEAFKNCVGLKNIGMNSGLRTIGESAFFNCSLEGISLPDTITKIGDNAFGNCDMLASIIAMNGDGSKYNAAANAFSGISSKCVLVTVKDAKGYDTTAFLAITRTEWIFYALPVNGMVAAGIDYQLMADASDTKNTKASYQWYRDGYEISGMTGNILILKNITPEYAGRYTVAITINGTRALFSCIIEVGGTTEGRTTFESKDAIRQNTEEPSEPDNTKYNTVKVTGADGKYLSNEFDITKIKKDEIIKLGFTDQPEEYTYIFYAKKLKEIYDEHKTGTFRISLNNGGYIDMPFGFISSVKNIDLTKDYQIRATIKETGRYSVYIAITDEKGKVLYDFKDANNLPGVYMYLPHENKEYTVRIDGTDAYPVPAVKDGDMIKFKIQNNLQYSIQTPKPVEFKDIKNHWGEEAIIKSSENLIVEGFPDGSYRPDGTLTRAEFTTMLMRALYHNLSNEQRVFSTTEKRRVYSDVKSGDWFRTNIGYADIIGLTGFITGNEFKPNQKITREEMAYMIAEAVKYVGIDTAKTAGDALNYTDSNEINAEYSDGVKICTNLKLLQGSGGYFKPKNGLTRAEAATVLNRLLNLMGENI